MKHMTAAVTVVLLGTWTLRAQIVERPIPGDPVKTESGAIVGKMLDTGVKAYLGVAYAAPPVGDLRWREPQPVTPWKGNYYAARKMPECIQPLRAHNINHYFGEEATSEDCLYMNIWAPASAKPGDHLPVIVFIYGGGFTIGSSGSALYDGTAMAERGAIFINFNYRLGALGFMAHPELTAESPHHASGNYGFLDQVAALQWIHRNIAKFGGDPAKVIISGQSAGAGSVSLLQATPLAKGTFRGIVAMSGSIWSGTDPPTLQQAETVGLKVQDALKAKSIHDLRLVAADKILSLQEDCQLGCAGSIRVGSSNVDGYLLPVAPLQFFANHQQSDVPVIVSFTHDESSSELRTAKNVSEYKAAATKLFGKDVDEFLKLYPATTDEEAHAMGIETSIEGGIEKTQRNWAIAQAKYGSAPVYIDMYSHVHPYTPGVVIADQNTATIGAYHTSDVPYWFGTQDAFNLFRSTRLWTPYDRDLSLKMSKALIAFANTGDPSTPEVHWPQWKPNDEQLIDFGDSIRVEKMDTPRLNFMAVHRIGGAPARTPGTRD